MSDPSFNLPCCSFALAPTPCSRNRGGQALTKHSWTCDKRCHCNFLQCLCHRHLSFGKERIRVWLKHRNQGEERCRVHWKAKQEPDLWSLGDCGKKLHPSRFCHNCFLCFLSSLENVSFPDISNAVFTVYKLTQIYYRMPEMYLYLIYV